MRRTSPRPGNEARCYQKLMSVLHPDGLACPHCGSKRFQSRSTADSVPSYQCSGCLRPFNAWTGTVLQGASCPPSRILAELTDALDHVARRDEIGRASRPDSVATWVHDEAGPWTLLDGDPAGVRPRSIV